MLTQDNKEFSIETPLGENALLLTGFTGREGISDLFQFDLTLISEEQSVNFEKIVGQNVTITAVLDEAYRFINGVVSRFSQEFSGSKDQGIYRYAATIVPWFWLLTRTSDSRIFQKMSVREIIEKVFSDNQFEDYRMDLTGKLPKREYTVQYNETDFNFVSRLLEEEGIFYFFEHEHGKHTMVIANHAGANASCWDKEGFNFFLSGREDFTDQIEQLTLKKQIRSGKYTLKDYNYDIPDTDLEVTYDTTIGLGPGIRERYDYPGGYEKRDAGDSLAAIRMEEEEARVATLSGTGSFREYTAGAKFTLRCPEQDVKWNNTKYLLTRVAHRMDQEATYTSGVSAGPGMKIYENQFECIPHDVPFRPPRKTPVPVIKGVQTAVVVGPAGEEIYTDELGRIKVQFHWDREGELNENSTCWLRVAQSMAGLGWGAVYLPRIGHEVIVEFLEGNPDRPIVTGQVYHGVNTPPYALPDEKTKTTFKSNSSPGGDGFNEIRFEDKAGEEQVFIHAQRNQDIRTKTDRYEWVGNESHLIVQKDQIEAIYENKHLSVLGNRNEAVDGSYSLETGGDIQEKTGGNHALDASGAIHLKAGMTIILEADTQISLKVGSNFIDIGSSGVTIQGTSVMINSGGAPGSGMGSNPEPPETPREADTAVPGKSAKILMKPPPPTSTPQVQALKDAAKSGKPLCDT
ncbi:MAG: type VI secretion system tip protein VgrG [Desulfobacter sp.]|nr:MAG: type VI secretion system tip protein VgrG [Desulfobacter sp.]